MNEKRPSQYLVEKCEVLDKVISFFSSNKGGAHMSADEKKLVFLHQIDFWDWEIENIIFSFDNFEERSKAWHEMGGATEYIKNNFGVMINPKIEYRSTMDRFMRNSNFNNPVYAPWEELNKIIDNWNELLDKCEEKILLKEKKAENAINLGAQLVKNLDKYRKKKKNEST